MAKKIFIIIGAIMILSIGVIAMLRFSTPEDSWICNNGNWVKHGNPNTEMPKDDCK